MDLFITSDANAESGLGEVVYRISGPTRKHFAAKDYGASLHGVGVVLMCRNPALKFKQRIKFVKKEKTLYLDIMLDLDQMRVATPEERQQIVIQRILKEVPEIIARKAIPDFNQEEFACDLQAWFASMDSS